MPRQRCRAVIKAGSAAKAREEVEKTVREEIRQPTLKLTNNAKKRKLERLVQARTKKPGQMMEVYSMDDTIIGASKLYVWEIRKCK